MSACYQPKTLAKTITYVAFHSPGEFGLFWDADGTMPWKELYWALHEDASLRFVRETHLKEIAFLGIEMPFSLDGSLLRLGEGVPAPIYPVVDRPPERLFYACRRQSYLSVVKHGLSPSSRPFVRLTYDKESAQRIAKRRDPEPMTIEIRAVEAQRGGIIIRSAGPTLFLVESVQPVYLICPPMREEQLLKLAGGPKKDKKPQKPAQPFSPGSFLLGDSGMHGAPGDKPAKKKGRGAEWKREARKDRTKRNV